MFIIGHIQFKTPENSEDRRRLGSEATTSGENVSFIAELSTQRIETVTPAGVVTLPMVSAMGVFGSDSKPSGT